MDLEALGPLGGDPGACLLGEEQGGASLQAQGVQEGASRQGQGQEVASHLLLGEGRRYLGAFAVETLVFL